MENDLSIKRLIAVPQNGVMSVHRFAKYQHSNEKVLMSFTPAFYSTAQSASNLNKYCTQTLHHDLPYATEYTYMLPKIQDEQAHCQ